MFGISLLILYLTILSTNINFIKSLYRHKNALNDNKGSKSDKIISF